MKNIILISGGNGGIGSAIVKKYLENDNIVIVLDINENKTLDNSNYHYIKTDVTDINQLNNALDLIKNKYGKITHLISLAGGTLKSEFNDLENIDINEIDKSIKLNLNSHIYLVKTFLSLIKNERDDKSIVLVSSVNALKGFKAPAYSSAKAGLYGFVHATTKELGKLGIRINTVSPGTVPTKRAQNEPKSLESLKKYIALDNFTSPDDVADAVYSVTNTLKSMTGQNIVIDAGQIA